MSRGLIRGPEEWIGDVQRGMRAGGGMPSDNFGCGCLLVIIFIIGAVVKAVMGW